MSQREQRAEELEALSKMFMSKGWKIVENDLVGSLNMMVTTKWHACKTGEELMQAKGEIEALARMVNFKALIASEIENFDKLQFADEEQPDQKNSLEE